MLWRDFFRKKCYAVDEGRFPRKLGLFDLTFLGIGAIIGAGIFVITGQAAALYAGPGIVPVSYTHLTLPTILRV